ncbi:uncharacterized protein LOC129762080 [Toxorhynchites rutilus septentrionalis]|uniref:uncharacterized protein LOC129762080 n=1 Tax=Toxorhynchites rutilus septentrionalis TaxID=329112 RepID=UPI002478FF5F|nr:uncharacterized protein LOC129762080 [Toxorhynchites rutilus septentrionalis]
MKVFIISAVLVACALAAPAPAEESSTSGTALNMALKYFGSCLESDEMGTCFAVKGITALNRAARASNIEIVPGVTFSRDPSAPVDRMGKSVSENEIISTLQTNAEDKSDVLFDMAIDSAKRLFAARSIQFKLPEEASETIARSIEEGRLLKKGKKLKKILGPLVLAIGGKLFALMPLLLGGVALLALKALFVSKIALVLAVILAVKKFVGGAVEGASTLGLLSKAVGGAAAGAGALGSAALAGGASGAGGSGWASGGGASGWNQGGAQYPYARSYDTAQDLAYNAQAPKS